jgi:hypothetical protein
MGVNVVPYINGRIFDTGTESWKANGGEAKKAAAKNNPGIFNATQ